MRFVPAIIIGVAIMLTPVVWFVTSRLLTTGNVNIAPAVDSAARIELEMLRQQVETAQARIEAMERQMAGLQALPPQTQTGQGTNFGDVNDPPVTDGDNAIIDQYAQVVLIADRRNVNRGKQLLRPRYLRDTVGLPRQNLGDTCQSMTNERLLNKMFRGRIGPINVQLLQPAAESMEEVFNEIRAIDADLYARINTAGGLCVRRIRGSQNSASLHAYGLAIDLNIDGQLDTLGDGKTQLGLTILADAFREKGWIWGAAFSREDSMHFEVGRDLFDQWLNEGRI
ncbi:MAG: M15 family metallopeptidase [Pseudomonadota bacterium]